MYYSHKMSLTICILTEFSNRPVAPATEATRVRHPSGPPGKPGRFPMDFLGISYMVFLRRTMDLKNYGCFLSVF